MDRVRGWRVLAALGAAVALLAVLVIVVASGDDGPSDPGTLTAERGPGPDTTSPRRGSASTSSSSPTSTALAPAGSSSSTSTPTTIAVRPPSTTTTIAATTSTVPATTTTTTTVPAHSPASCPAPGPSSDFAGFTARVVAIEDGRGRHESCMLIADTPERRRQGLMDQDDLDGYAGMAFLFEDAETRSFWMHRTRIPLSIAFFDASGAFVSARDMEPCASADGSDCPMYSSGGPAQFAVEVPQGQLPEVGATPGSTFRV